MNQEPSPPQPTHPWRWLPEFCELGRRRLRAQARLVGLSLIVGVIAGFGAILFHLACQIVVYVALDLAAGYHPVHPGGEPDVVAESDTPFRPWVLLLVAPLGGLLSGLVVYTFAPEAEGHGTDAAIAAYH
jgi:CIC family chloride channel protein